MKKKWIAWLLCVALLLPILSVTVLAAPGGSGEMTGIGQQSNGGQQSSTSRESPYAEAAELFEQYVFTDEETGLEIPYNLFLPEGYDEDEDTEYPIVIFVADASVNSNEVTDVLTQDGALVWATEEEQAKHPCIVLAPQYTTDLVNSIGMLVEDDYVWTEGLTLVTDLIFYILDAYRVDMDRIYGTGQSQGGMMTIAISDKYPDLYAAQYLVACQWNTDEMVAMADDQLWIMVCEGDSKAYPTMNTAIEVWTEAGAQIVQYDEMWDSTSTAEQFDALVASMTAQEGTIHYTVCEGGDHMYTWTFAYTIEGIRDWLFEQAR